MACLSAVLCLAVFLTAVRLAGLAAGVAAAVLYAFDPLVIAHAGLATTDLGGTCFYFLGALALPRAIREGGAARIGGAAVACGLAWASKFSTVPLLALAAWLALMPAAARRAPRLLRAAAITAGAIALVVACYGPWGPKAWLQGWSMLRVHEAVGHPTYAFGLYGSRGWWWYFPAAWAVKTPIPVLLATACGVPLALARSTWSPAVRVAALLAPAAMLAGAATSSLNLGVRHLLPIVPFLAVCGGIAAARAWTVGWVGRAAACGLGAWLVLGTLAVHPDELAYANEAAGGSKRTWRHLADSNVDWGQDLPALAASLRPHPLRRLYLGYFGTADPGAYGLRYVWSPAFGEAPRRFQDGPDPEGREWIAVSVTNLLDVYTLRHDAHAWLRDRPMTAFPGHSIALWDITGDAGAHRRIGETAVQLGDLVAAEPALRRAVDLAPEDAGGRIELARVLAALGAKEEAEAQCASAVPHLPIGAAELAWCEALGDGGGRREP